MQILIMCRSLTRAQRSELLLERRGIGASVVKAPQALRENGCGYAVVPHRHPAEAIALLRENGLLNGRIFRLEGNGRYTEVSENDLP